MEALQGLLEKGAGGGKGVPAVEALQAAVAAASSDTGSHGAELLVRTSAMSPG